MADSAEPKSIDEIRIYGVNIMATEKGAGSVLQGIQYVQNQRISVTRKSTNLVNEYHNYIWKKDKDGKITNIPEGGYDHIIDAIRYGFNAIKPKNEHMETKISEQFNKNFHRQNLNSTK